MLAIGKKRTPKLTRGQSLGAVPVLNQLIRVEHSEQQTVILHLPRKRTSMVRLVARVFRLTPYKRIELDELGTFAVELCDGQKTVAEIIGLFGEKFQLNRREAEVSMLTYLRSLAKRGIIAFAVPKDTPQ